jgi:hypothetical protein
VVKDLPMGDFEKSQSASDSVAEGLGFLSKINNSNISMNTICMPEKEIKILNSMHV